MILIQVWTKLQHVIIESVIVKPVSLMSCREVLRSMWVSQQVPYWLVFLASVAVYGLYQISLPLC